MSQAMLMMEGVSKRFGTVEANRDVSLTVRPGELHALVGENGAGKSTAMKVVYGLVRPDRGRVVIAGHDVGRHHTPARAMALGVGMVHQHFMLVPTLTAAENVVLGREPRRRGLLDIATACEQVSRLSDRFGLAIRPDQLVSSMSVGEQQRLEILKVLYRGAEALILDEPTAVLTPREVADLFAVVRRLVEAGKAAVLITHKLDEVMSYADVVTVMRQGATVATMNTKETTPPQIARAMVGREVLLCVDRPPRQAEGPVLLEAKGLWVERVPGVPALKDVSFTVRGGEILGVAGVEGNGQTELMEVMGGLRPLQRGQILLDGKDMSRASPKERFVRGLAHVPEDRHRRGLILDMTVMENLILGRHHEFGGPLGLDRRRIKEYASAAIKEYDLRPPLAEAVVSAFSGGNQQKVVIARELSRSLKVLLAAQPTRGVDIGAIEFIHRRILEARAAGKAVLLVSAELQEILSLSDRVIVLYRGEVQAERRPEETSREELGLLMTGGVP